MASVLSTDFRYGYVSEFRSNIGSGSVQLGHAMPVHRAEQPLLLGGETTLPPGKPRVVLIFRLGLEDEGDTAPGREEGAQKVQTFSGFPTGAAALSHTHRRKYPASRNFLSVCGMSKAIVAVNPPNAAVSGARSAPALLRS